MRLVCRCLWSLIMLVGCSSAQVANDKTVLKCTESDAAAIVLACGSATGLDALVCAVAAVGADVATCVAQLHAGSGSAAAAAAAKKAPAVGK